MYASEGNKKEVVKVLIEARADPFLRDNKVGSISNSSNSFSYLQGNKTARDYAREDGYSDLERLLGEYERDFEGLKGLR